MSGRRIAAGAAIAALALVQVAGGCGEGGAGASANANGAGTSGASGAGGVTSTATGAGSTPVVPGPDEPVAPDPSEMPPPQRLDAVDLVVGLKRFQAEVARTDSERQRGLMSRRDLAGGDRGMLFVFPRAKVLRFWMKNTPSPLSIAFLEEDGTIIEIDDMRPFDLDGTVSSRTSRRALEMPQGWFATNGVKPGDRIFGLERAGDSLD